MYKYSAKDKKIVNNRTKQFENQVQRRIKGKSMRQDKKLLSKNKILMAGSLIGLAFTCLQPAYGFIPYIYQTNEASLQKKGISFGKREL